MKQLSDEFYKSIYPHLRFLDDVSLNADGNATVKLINKTINQYANSPFIKFVVQVIDEISKNEFDFCKNLFDISCKLVRYRRDPDGHEIVFTPLLLIRVREGDCKKFATFICAVLKCRGIVSATKVVTYEAYEPIRWQHIYAIAWPKGYNGALILDPVNYKEFNSEVKYEAGRVNFYDGTYSKIIMSKLSMMGNVPNRNETFLGLGEAANDFLGDLEDISGNRRFDHKHFKELEDQYIQGVYDDISGPDDDMSGLDEIGKKTKAQRKEKRKVNKAKRVEKRKKIFSKVKKVGLAPVRGAFLALIGAGGLLAKHTKLKFNLAAKLAELWKKDNGASLIKIWEKFGGKKEALKNAIIKASHTQINGGIYGIPINDPEGMGVVQAGVIIAAVTAAAPILVLVIKLLYNKAVLKKQEAAEAADTTENLEAKNTDANGNLNPELVETLKNNVPIVKKVMELDNGGDAQAQAEIKKTAPSYNTSSDGGGGGGNNGGGGFEQQHAPGPTPPPITDKGFNLLGASSWLTGSIYVQIIAEAQGINEILSNTVGVIMLTVSIFLFTKQK